jgi:hypothetical protein
MESGEEIVFADEYGSWMIPGDEKHYFVSEAYRSAIRVATKAQRELLAAEIDRLKIKTEHTV